MRTSVAAWRDDEPVRQSVCGQAFNEASLAAARRDAHTQPLPFGLFRCAGALPTARNPVAAGRPVVEPAPEHKIDLTSPFARIAHHASRSGDAVLGDTLLLKAGPEPFGTQAANWLASL